MTIDVLLTDDSATTRAMLRKLLGMTDLPIGTIHEAGDGEQALELLEREPVDLMICDLNMPRLDGLELLRRLSDDGRLAALPVIVLSTEGSDQRVAQLREYGVRVYLRKPCTPEAMRDAIWAVTETMESGDDE